MWDHNNKYGFLGLSTQKKEICHAGQSFLQSGPTSKLFKYFINLCDNHASLKSIIFMLNLKGINELIY